MQKKISLAALTLVATTVVLIIHQVVFALPVDDFIITVKTDNPGTSAATEFTIPTTGGGYDYNVDCDNDGIDEAMNQTGSYTCDYMTSSAGTGAGTYTVRIKHNDLVGHTGFPRIYFNNGGDAEKLLSIEQWGTTKWTSMERAFYSCINVVNNATDVPDLSSATSLLKMFQNAPSIGTGAATNWNLWDVSTIETMELLFSGTSLSQPIGDWDTSNVTNMRSMFSVSSFNQPIGNWDVSKVEDMDNMFVSSDFNQPIGNWDVSSVTDMFGMFQDTAFNQPIGSWDVSNVETMPFMFAETSAFNQPIGDWDVSSVENMDQMFALASAFNQPIGDWDTSSLNSMYALFAGSTFNQPISNWDVSGVTNMGLLFFTASAFDQPLGDWDVSGVTDMTNMFNGANLSIVNYDETLIGWDAQVLQSSVPFHAGVTRYCSAAAQAARANMVAPLPGGDNWMITDGGLCALVEFSTASSSDVESSGGDLPVLLVNGTITNPTTITVTVTGGSAVEGADYDFGTPQTVVIPVGFYDGTLGTALGIPMLSVIDDGDVEVNEDVAFALSLAMGDVAIGDANADNTVVNATTYLILNDDVGTSSSRGGGGGGGGRPSGGSTTESSDSGGGEGGNETQNVGNEEVEIEIDEDEDTGCTNPEGCGWGNEPPVNVPPVQLPQPEPAPAQPPAVPPAEQTPSPEPPAQPPAEEPVPPAEPPVEELPLPQAPVEEPIVEDSTPKTPVPRPTATTSQSVVEEPPLQGVQRETAVSDEEDIVRLNLDDLEPDEEKVPVSREPLEEVESPVEPLETLDQCPDENDSDGDGLTDQEECELGSDPLLRDTDGDGMDDLQELLDFGPGSVLAPGQNTDRITIVSPQSGQVFVDPSPFIRGFAPLSAPVTISAISSTNAAQTLGTAEISENGIFLFETPFDLRDDTYVVWATQGDVESERVTFTIDTTLDLQPPELTYLEDQELRPVLLEGLRVEIVNNMPVLYGVTEIGNKVVATWNSAVISSALIADAGEFSMTSPRALELGEHAVYVSSLRRKDNIQSATIRVPFTLLEEDLKSAALEERSSSGWWFLGGGLTLAIVLVIFYLHRGKKEEQPSQT